MDFSDIIDKENFIDSEFCTDISPWSEGDWSFDDNNNPWKICDFRISFDLNVPIFDTVYEPKKCCICGKDTSYDLLFQFDHKCYYHFCCQCVTQYVWLKSELGYLHKIKCPGIQCKSILSEKDIEIMCLKNDALKKSREKLCIQMDIQIMREFFQCPIPECLGEGFQLDDKNSFVVCNMCAKKFCFICKEESHSGITCEQINGLNIQNHTNLNKKKSHHQCPECKIWIEENRRYSNIKCWKCMVEFCWQCGEKYSNGHNEEKHRINNIKNTILSKRRLVKIEPKKEIVKKIVFHPYIPPISNQNISSQTVDNISKKMKKKSMK